MKSAKKYIYIKKKGYVFEAEILYTDPLKKEYENVKNKIKKTLYSPKLTQLEKRVKYQSLNRKRKNLTKEIESNPLKIVVDSNPQKDMPTTGIESKTKPLNLQEKIQQENFADFDALQIEQNDENQEQEQAQIALAQNVVEAQKSKLAEYKGIIPKNKFDDLANYVYENRVRFGILETGQIYKNKKESNYVVPGSRYRDVLKYMTGDHNLSNDQKNVAGILIRRLLKDDEIKNFMQQQGQGKKRKHRYIIDTNKTQSKNILKTKGLIRKFRPTLWTKIPT